MTELLEIGKIPFLGLLELQPIPSDSIKILSNHTAPTLYLDILDKNNRTITGYENFCIKKGTIELFPVKDFDFVGKHVVCLKCCQKFASKMSYRAHVGTDFCVRTYNGPNPVYLKYKNKNGKRNRKKNNLKSLEDLHGHDIKKNLLNPEMLNTLQTRKKCYSDAVLERYKVKEKQVSNKNNEFSMKKPRGRPRKNIEVEPKKRGRPRKLSTPLDGNLSPNKNGKSLNDNSKNNEIMFMKPKIVSISSVDAYNNNVGKSEKLKSLYSKMKFLTGSAWRIINSDNDLDINSYQNYLNRYNPIPSSKKEENNLLLDVELIASNLKSLIKEYQDWNQDFNKEEIDLILSKLEEKRNENKNKHKKTDYFSESITDKGKENIESAGKQSKDETEINIIKECEEIWLNDDHVNSVSLPVILNNDSPSTDYENLEIESTSEDSFEDLESLVKDKFPDFSSSNKHLNQSDSNYIFDPARCTVCGKQFASIGECKVHHSEHIAIPNRPNKEFLCKICGHKCKIFNNFIKHINSHNNVEKDLTNNKNLQKNLKCKICNRQYNYLRSFYTHVKTHIKVIH